MNNGCSAKSSRDDGATGRDYPRGSGNHPDPEAVFYGVAGIEVLGLCQHRTPNTFRNLLIFSNGVLPMVSMMEL
jgi:hypothetical protein